MPQSSFQCAFSDGPLLAAGSVFGLRSWSLMQHDDVSSMDLNSYQKASTPELLLEDKYLHTHTDIGGS